MSQHTKLRLRLSDDAFDLAARAGLTMKAWAQRADVSYATVKGLKNPEHQPKRRGGVRRDIAWKLARAYATVAAVDEQTAFDKLVVEEVTA